MKKFILMIFTAFLFFTFSCASTDSGQNDDLRTAADEFDILNVEPENENSNLLKEIAQLISENSNLHLENNELLSDNIDMRLENIELQINVVELINENVELIGKIEEQEAENDVLQNTNAQLTEDNEQLRDIIGDLNRGIASLIDEIVQLIDSNDQLTARVDELLADNNQLRNNVNDLLNINQNRQNENDQLRARIEVLENENHELTRENDNLRSRLDELRNWFTNVPPSNPVTPAETPAQPVPETQLPPAQTPPVETPPVQIMQAPLVETPPVQITQVPPVETPPPAETPVNEETIIETPLPYFAPAPAVRLESPAQMGMTPLDTEIHFSRIVRATAGQILEIPFRGNGWVYLGEIASRRGIVYDSRRNEADGQSFIFSLAEPGTYILKFYRQDFLRDFILNDHVQVIVGEAQAATAGWFNPSLDRTRIVAQPRWPSALEEAQILSGRPPSEPVVTNMETPAAVPSQTVTPGSQGFMTPGVITQQTQTGTQGTLPQISAVSPAAASTQQTPAAQAQQGMQSSIFNAESFPGATAVYDPQFNNLSGSQFPDMSADTQPVPENIPWVSPNELLRSAQESFDRGNITAAIPLLEQYNEYYPGGSDESLWLLGQLYEANSPNRNILFALENYRRLTNEYPQSSRFEEARRRIAYLERFYISIQ